MSKLFVANSKIKPLFRKLKKNSAICYVVVLDFWGKTLRNTGRVHR